MGRKVLNSGLSLWALRCFCDVQWRWSRSSPRIWVKVPAPDTFQILIGTLIFLAFQLILATTSFSFPQNCENYKQTNIKISNLGQGHTSVRNRNSDPQAPTKCQEGVVAHLWLQLQKVEAGFQSKLASKTRRMWVLGLRDPASVKKVEVPEEDSQYSPWKAVCRHRCTHDLWNLLPLPFYSEQLSFLLLGGSTEVAVAKVTGCHLCVPLVAL